MPRKKPPNERLGTRARGIAVRGEAGLLRGRRGVARAVPLAGLRLTGFVVVAADLRAATFAAGLRLGAEPPRRDAARRRPAAVEALEALIRHLFAGGALTPSPAGPVREVGVPDQPRSQPSGQRTSPRS